MNNQRMIQLIKEELRRLRPGATRLQYHAVGDGLISAYGRHLSVQDNALTKIDTEGYGRYIIAARNSRTGWITTPAPVHPLWWVTDTSRGEL